MKTRRPKPGAAKRPDDRARSKRAALNALRRARRAALRSGVDLSSWEGEFLGSVEERLNTFGRAFGDPEKGAPGQALSALQTIKLKEIAAKVLGKNRDEPKSSFRAKPGEGSKSRFRRNLRRKDDPIVVEGSKE
jgi:hypothetical protein